MNIIIEKITKNEDLIFVDFSSDLGSSRAVWAGEKPVLGSSYDVEIDIDDDLVWGEDIVTASKSTCMVSSSENKFCLVAKVISSESDGCLSVALGNSVLLLDVEGLPGDISGVIECNASEVKLYSTNL